MYSSNNSSTVWSWGQKIIKGLSSRVEELAVLWFLFFSFEWKCASEGISGLERADFELQINSNQMNRTWKSIKRDSNKTKIYLVIALLSDEVFNRCSNGQSLIYPQNQVESGWNENGRSFAPMQKVIEQNLPSSLLIFPNPHGPWTIHFWLNLRHNRLSTISPPACAAAVRYTHYCRHGSDD